MRSSAGNHEAARLHLGDRGETERQGVGDERARGGLALEGAEEREALRGGVGLQEEVDVAIKYRPRASTSSRDTRKKTPAHA